MKMFLGEYNPNITEGSRIALPKKLREQIVSDDIVLAKGFEKCVLLYEKQDWAEKVEKQVENLKDQVKRSDLERYLFTSASEASVDSQGRLVIPTPLKEFAGIKSETAVIGVGDHIEIWDKDTWVSHLEEITNGLSQTNSFK